MKQSEIIDTLIDIYIKQNPDKTIDFENRNNWIDMISFSAATGKTILESVNMLQNIVEMHVLRTKHKINSRFYFIINISKYKKYQQYYG